MKIASAIFKTFLLSLCVVANTHLAYAQTASILPPAKTQFLDNSGKPLTSGKVDFYIPSTTTRKTTWQDAAETIPNTNPVVLDAGGRATILGEGSYRQVVKDRNGNTIWDAVTSSTGSGSSGSIATGDGDLVGTIKPWAGMTAPNQYAFTYGQEVSRTTFATLFTAITSSQATFCTSASPILTGLSDTSNFWVGMSVEVSCVAAGFSTVISKTSSTVTLAANANVTTNTTAVFFPWGRGNGSTTFNLPDFRGFAIAGNNIMGGVASANLTTTYFGATDPNSSGAAGGSQSKVLLTANLPAYTPAGTIAGTVPTSAIAGGTTVSGPGGTDVSKPSGTSAITATFTGTAQGGTSTAFSIVQPTKTSNYIIKTTPDANSATASGVTAIQSMTGSIACGSGLLCTGNTISVSLNTEFTYVTQAPYNAVCDGVTDDSIALQAAINATPAAGWTLYVPSGRTCAFGSPLDFKGHPNLKLGGFGGMSTGANTTSKLIYTGSGATAAMDFRDSNFNGIFGLTIVSSNAGFSGFIINAGATIPSTTITSGFTLTDVTIGNNISTVSGCVDISEAIEIVLTRVNFSRCAPGVKGQDVFGQSTTVTIEQSQFVNIPSASYAIQDCGDSWKIYNNAFQQNDANQAVAFFNSTSRPCRGVTFDANWFGDATVAGGTWIQLTAEGASVTGNRFSMPANSNAIGLTGGFGYSIEGNSFAGGATSVGLFCSSSPNGGMFNSNYVPTITPIGGTCVNFTRQSNNPSTSDYTAGQIGVGQTADDVAPKSVSGDATLAATGALTLTTVNANVGSFGSATNCATITTNAKGLITAASQIACTPATATTATNATNIAITDDIITNATMYPVWVTATTGNLPAKVSSDALVWNPSTHRLGVGTSAPQALLQVGPGIDASGLSPNFYVNNSGTASFAVRDSSNDIEMGMFTNTAGGGLVAMGSRTSHPFWIQTNASNMAAFHVSTGFSVGNTTDPGTGAISATTTVKGTTGFILTNRLSSSTAPVATTFCTTPSIPANNGTAAFTINVGTGCATSTGVITMPAATTGWVCDFQNVTNNATSVIGQTGGTTTTVTITNYVRTTGVAGNWTSSDVIRAKCSGY